MIHTLLLASFVAAAQAGPPADRPTPNRDSVWGAALARLRPGKTIRIHLIGNGRIEGEFAHGSATTLTLAGTPAPVEHSTAALDSLWVRGTGAKTGALIGGVAGLLVGTAFGVLINGSCEADGASCGGWVPGAGLAGAAVVGLLGAAIGSGFTHWRRRVP